MLSQTPRSVLKPLPPFLCLVYYISVNKKNDSESRKQRELKQEKVARRDQIYFKCVLNLFKATVK